MTAFHMVGGLQGRYMFPSLCTGLFFGMKSLTVNIELGPPQSARYMKQVIELITRKIIVYLLWY